MADHCFALQNTVEVTFLSMSQSSINHTTTKQTLIVFPSVNTVPEN